MPQIKMNKQKQYSKMQQNISSSYIFHAFALNQWENCQAWEDWDMFWTGHELDLISITARKPGIVLSKYGHARENGAKFWKDLWIFTACSFRFSKFKLIVIELWKVRSRQGS